jgi:4-alpha-glucanotransferase
MEKTGYSWWIQRIEHLISFVDYVRIDHFRGLFGFWEIPAGSDTALSGRWKHAKGRDLLRSIARRNPYLPVIAEDLGVITPDVREGMRELSIPGMKVLLFAFGAGMSGSPYIPHNIVKDCVVYTGTHDNNPVRGWYDEEAGEEERTNFAAYIGKTVNPDDASRDFIRLAMMSVANTVIIPMQDILNLGSDSRMNRPGTEEGNWRWRAEQSQMTRDIAQNLRQIAGLYDRV